MKKYYLLFLTAFFLSASDILAADLKTGDAAPAFSTVDEIGIPVKLEDYLGKNLLLYFYPKNNTPGCTSEAEGFRDRIAEFKKRDITILGVSFDSAASHKSFKQKHALPFRLLLDEDKKIAGSYGSGGIFMPSRHSFLIGPDGKIIKIYREVSPKQHAEEILNDFDQWAKQNPPKSS